MTRTTHASAAAVLTLSAATLLVGVAAPAEAQRVRAGAIAETYETHCAACHGADLSGGLGSSLIDETWTHGSSREAVTSVITEGLVDAGMPGYADILSAEEIAALVTYIQEVTLVSASAARTEALAPNAAGVVQTERAAYQLETVYEDAGHLWSVEFLPDGAKLMTDLNGRLIHRGLDGTVSEIDGVPAVAARNQGGMLDIGLAPDHAETGWIYLAFSEPLKRNWINSGQAVQSMTTVVRGKLDGTTWVDQELIWRAREEHFTSRVHHFGTRFAFDAEHVFFAVGDRGEQDTAQDLSLPSGKVYRVRRDGTVPEDNPFVDVEGAYPAIWSYGHRNPQGLVMHPETGALLSTEHGPRGGDEFNIVEPGLNYGWPVITYGINYNGTPITSETAREGMEQPLTYWTPSIAVCGLDVYTGDAFADWSGDVLAGGLAAEEVYRLRIEDGVIAERELIVKGQGRVRDVKVGPSGYVYLVINRQRDGDSAVVRLRPAEV